MADPSRPFAPDLPFRVTDACNAHCRFCEEHVPRATPDLADRAVLDRLDDALRAHVERHGAPPRRLIFTGGEPTLQRALLALIERAAAAGAQQVWLQTNGFALGAAAAAERLRAAGLHGVIVGLYGGDPEATARRMRREGALAFTHAGIVSARAAGLAVELTTVALPEIIVELEASLAAAPAWAAGIATLTVHAYRGRGPHPAPRDLEPALLALQATLTRLGIALAGDPGRGFHPCAFGRGRALAPLLRGRATGDSARFVQLPPCRDCALVAQCDGVERSLAEALGEAVVAPLQDARRALWAGVQERTRHSERTDRVDVREGQAGAERRREHVIRVNHACNQRCAFCWVDFEAGEMPADAVRAAIAQALAGSNDPGAEAIAFTGGEPTLRADLPALVAMAREAGAGRVHLQTNAVRLADAALTERLATAGLSEALVSLHADVPELADAVVAAPGSFTRTLQGIEQLLAAGVDVVVNHVLTRATAVRLSRFVDLLADRFVDAAPADTAGRGALTLTLAVASHIDRGPLDPSVLPTQSELAEPVRAGLLRARIRGLRVRDLSHPCGFALCVLDPALEALDLAAVRRVPTAGRLGEAEGCVKPEATCGTCALEPYCFGLRAEYVAEHGSGELRPFAPAIGVVGLGPMGARHAQAAAALAMRRVVVVRHADDAARADALPPAPAAPLRVADAAILPAAGVGLAVVAVPTPRHADVVTPLLHAGVAVLCEKPLAGSLEAADAMLEAGPGRLFVAHTCRAEPATQAALAALPSLGTWRSVVIERVEPPRPLDAPARDAALVDLLVHDLGQLAPELAAAGSGQIERARRLSAERDGIDGIEAGMAFGEIAVALRVGWHAATTPGARAISVHAEAGSVCWSVHAGRATATLSRPGEADAALPLTDRPTDVALLEMVLDALATAAPSPLDGWHGRDALAWALALATSCA